MPLTQVGEELEALQAAVSASDARSQEAEAKVLALEEEIQRLKVRTCSMASSCIIS